MNTPILPFYPLINKNIVMGEGCYLYDEEGKKYLDLESGDWAAILGHSNPRITEVIREQADTLMHDGLRFRNQPSEKLASKLLEKFSFKDGKCTFLNSGSEAVNLAITLAKNLTKRGKILKMDCSYLSAFGHGQTYSSNADIFNVAFDDMDSIRKIDFNDVAAFVFEPGNARGYVKFPSPEFIRVVAHATKQYGGFLIANEVTTGFGRTGKWFGYQYYDFSPDMVSTGKAMGNGYPVSGIAVNKEVSEQFSKSPFRYAQSHQNDPLGCAVALEVINMMNELDIAGQSFTKGQFFKHKLSELQLKYPDKIKEIRGRGLMIAIEFHENINTENLILNLIQDGFLVGCRGNVLSLMPPLVIDNSEIDEFIFVLEKLIIL